MAVLSENEVAEAAKNVSKMIFMTPVGRQHNGFTVLIMCALLVYNKREQQQQPSDAVNLVYSSLCPKLFFIPFQDYDNRTTTVLCVSTRHKNNVFLRLLCVCPESFLLAVEDDTF